MAQPLLTDRFTKALTVAHEWHAPQKRKGTETPYISHLLGVASIALEFGANEDQAIAALLHDALEDGPEFTGRDASDLRQEIAKQFGERVALMVEGATDATPKAGETKAPWAERKSDYLKVLINKEADMLLVSASDKLHNARTILTDVMTAEDSAGVQAFFGRFSQGQEGTLQYYRRLVDTSVPDNSIFLTLQRE
ncbi:hypothetical protein Dxin01_04287 [Deinococcus xinjiangensis]|uniref:HD/PDEase domain-containing protein n=1 Tax=Deinococcus xinjiangensis TaxID=457454 RepID=A0ABP9VH23_9DEIO